jgi:hypothetical protein
MNKEKAVVAWEFQQVVAIDLSAGDGRRHALLADITAARGGGMYEAVAIVLPGLPIQF